MTKRIATARRPSNCGMYVMPTYTTHPRPHSSKLPRRAPARIALALMTLHMISGIAYIVRLNFVVSAHA